MQIDAKSAESLDAVRRVGNPKLPVLLARMCRHGRQYRRFDFFSTERAISNRSQHAFHPDRCRSVWHEKKVAAVALEQCCKPLLQFSGFRQALFGMNHLNVGGISLCCHLVPWMPECHPWIDGIGRSSAMPWNAAAAFICR